jgi:hypothetical protein
MFDRERLETLLDLQARSYALLRWVNERVQAGSLRLEAIHGGLDEGAAALNWLRRNASVLPADARPPEGALEPLAHLFASYLTTSFEPARTKWVTDGCRCGFCSYLVAAPNLRARTPSAEDRRVARELKLDCLEELAAEEGLALFREELAALIRQAPALVRSLAMVTWAREVARRSEFRGQGSPVLALWREFAWKDGRPDRDFELTTEAVLEAERVLRSGLRVLHA